MQPGRLKSTFSQRLAGFVKEIQTYQRNRNRKKCKMWLRKTSVVFLNAQDYMGYEAGSWKDRNYNTFEKIPKSKNYMALYGWQGRFWAISLDFSAAPGNHLQSQTSHICLLYPSSNDHNTMYMMLFISCLLFVCSLFNESESPPFALDGVALTSLWMRIKRAFHFQSNDVNPSPPLPGMVHKSANLCPTDTVFKIQTNNDKDC